MKIAYLILAHNQPEQLFKLYSSLNDEHTSFYIHVDKKSKDVESISNRFRDMPNVKVISVYEVFWMGFNMIQGSIELMKMAMASGHDYKYFVLLSGQDYPIKSKEGIRKFYEENTKDFIDYNKIAHLPAKFTTKYKLRHSYDWPYANPRDPRKITFLVKLYYRLKKVEQKLLPARKFYKDFTPYFGSQWFSLTNETVKYILGFLAANQSYSDFMRTTEGPDETFFHTIIGNSERRFNLSNYDQYLEWEKTWTPGAQHFRNPISCLTFMDWSERGKSKPAVLDMGYFDELKATYHLYARKFDVLQSKELINKIDTNLR